MRAIWPFGRKKEESRAETIQFIVHPLTNQPDVVRVRYACECGCKPSADYTQGSDEANFEHCCCGRVHFVGAHADERLRAYLDERRAQGQDVDMSYTFYAIEVAAPWGDAVPVAYAVPEVPRPH